MRNYIISLFVSYIGYSLIGYAAEPVETELKPIQPTIIEQQNAAWSDMHNYAETRAQWYKENLQTLKDSSIDSAERANLAQKIMPYQKTTVETIIANKSRTTDRSRLSAAMQKKTKDLCFINIVSVDLSYSFLYWDFLSRVLSFYSTPNNSSPETRSAVLPHLVRELINFDEYAVVDIEGDTRCRYVVEEFYVNRAIYEECKDLAESYGIQIDKIMQMKTEDSDVTRDLELSDIAKLEKVTLSTDTVKPSNKLLYFMEQVMNRKRQATSDTSPPDLSKGLFLAFQSYILPSTGPIFIKELPLPTLAKPASYLPPNLSKASTTRKTKNNGIKKKPGGEQRRKQPEKQALPPKQELKIEQDLSPQNSESATSSESVSTKESVSEVKTDLEIKDDKKTLSQASALPKLTIADKKPTPVLQATTSASSTTPSIGVRPNVGRMPQPVMIKSLTNIRDIRPHIQHRSSSSYLFLGKEHPFPIGKEDLRCFEPGFLGEIKRLTHLSPSTDKLPNVALGAITFYYQIDNVDMTKTVKFQELFLSGGKYFDNVDLDFKARHHIINALQDTLTSEDKKTVSSLQHPDKSIQLGIRMEKYLRRQIIEGPWKNNCLDSEAVFALFLVKKLPTLLMNHFRADAEHPINFTGAVIAISSYRDCCPKCQQVIQGLQWRLGEFILDCNIANLYVDQAFSTLAIVKGHKRLTGEKYVHEMPSLEKGPATLGKMPHTLVNVPFI